MSLTAAMNIANTSLQASQSALGTVSNNLANVNTAGYTRQRINLSAASTDGQNMGVRMDRVQRSVDSFLEGRIVTQTSLVGYAETKQNVMRSVETLFGNGDFSLDNQLNQFFEQLNTLANDPTSSAQQVNVVNKAQSIATNLNNMSSELTDTINTAEDQINQSLDKVNTLLSQIYELNKEIASLTSGGMQTKNSSALEDQRQVYANELATYMTVQTNTDQYGNMRVLTENGRRLIDGAGYTQLERTTGTPYQGVGARGVGADGTLSNTSLPIEFDTMSGGSLKALVDIRDTEIPNIQAELDNLATTFASEFNRLHSQGTSSPAQNSLTIGNNDNISLTTSDIYSEVDPALAGSTFDISIVDANGNVVSSTSTNAGGAGPITLPGAGPFSLTDLETMLNANTDINGDITVSVANDADGNPAITVAATNSNYGIVMKNVSGDALGTLGFNNFFTGTNAASLAVRSDIASDPSKIATAQMRDSDGGLSKQDNSNIIEMAKLTETEVSFSAAGSLGSQSDSLTGYIISMSATLAIKINDLEEDVNFSQSFLDDMQERFASDAGVNMDEELSQLIIFQNAYQASARVMTVVDEMFDTLVNSIR